MNGQYNQRMDVFLFILDIHVILLYNYFINISNICLIFDIKKIIVLIYIPI
nr:MAG TPA: hypothetical protein [Bacteriophage sp.]